MTTLSGVYIHHDGYPEGAATYFYNALKESSKYYLENNDESWIESYGYKFMGNFIRSNANAEITHGSEGHSGLEYIYKMNIVSRKITVLQLNWSKVKMSDYQFEFWDEVETYTLADFLKKYNQYPDDSNI